MNHYPQEKNTYEQIIWESCCHFQSPLISVMAYFRNSSPTPAPSLYRIIKDSSTWATTQLWCLAAIRQPLFLGLQFWPIGAKENVTCFVTKLPLAISLGQWWSLLWVPWGWHYPKPKVVLVCALRENNPQITRSHNAKKLIDLRESVRPA